MAPKQRGIHSKLSFNAKKNFFYIVSRTLAAYACPCMRAHTISMCTHGLSVRMPTRVCMRTLRVSCCLSFPKISYIFHKHFPQINFHLIGS